MQFSIGVDNKSGLLNKHPCRRFKSSRRQIVKSALLGSIDSNKETCSQTVAWLKYWVIKLHRLFLLAASESGRLKREWSFAHGNNETNYTFADERTQGTMLLPYPSYGIFDSYQTCYFQPPLQIVFRIPDHRDESSFNSTTLIDFGGSTAQSMVFNLLCDCATSHRLSN